MNIRLENTTFAGFNTTLGINDAHFWSTIRIQIQEQIILLDEQIQIMTSLHTSTVKSVAIQ